MPFWAWGRGWHRRLLPQPFGRWLVTAALVALVPGVFLTSSMVQYQIWVTHLADAETLPYVQAREVADTFLKNRMGQDGFLGFYLYTARYPLIPERASDMGDIEALRQEVTTRIGKVTQLSSPVVSLLFSLCAWGLRSFLLCPVCVDHHLALPIWQPQPGSAIAGGCFRGKDDLRRDRCHSLHANVGKCRANYSL
ncbi:MAG: hypothetical protein HC925_03320 [Coleofasciculaceae cyanobacterium SM2_3_26]|nr:hypothetical protein [Coleofasciculaceae cyanobacterium SM2_3_26]